MSLIFWINGTRAPHLAIVTRPQGYDWLDDELHALQQEGLDTLVSLLETEEAAALGLAEEQTAATTAGLQFLSFPIPDKHVPGDRESFQAFVHDLAARLKRGEKVGIHCRGSIGRATLAACAVLIELGWDPQSALVAVTHARGTAVPDTPEQESWIFEYAAE